MREAGENKLVDYILMAEYDMEGSMVGGKEGAKVSMEGAR